MESSSFPQSQSNKDWVSRVGTSLPMRLLLLASVSLIAILLISAWSTATGRIAEDLIWIVASFFCCTFCGVAMLLFDWNARSIPAAEDSVSAFLHVAFGFIFRMGIPLLACGFVALQLDTARARSFACYLLVLYPLVLFTETLLTVWRRRINALSIPPTSGRNVSGGLDANRAEN